MEKGALEEALAQLGSSTEKASVQLEQASNLIGINLEQESRNYFENVVPCQPTSYDTFKEQWLLRWLLRKLTFPSTDSQDVKTDPKILGFVLNTHYWTLLLHLISRISEDVCLDILNERNFCSLLANSIRYAKTSIGPEELSKVELQRSDDSQPRKKRRLSPSPVLATSLDSLKAEQLPRLSIILKVAQRYADLLHHGSEGKIQNQPCFVTSGPGSVNDAANLIGSVLDSVCLVLQHGVDEAQKQTLLPIIEKVISLWYCRPSDRTKVEKSKASQTFNKTCLAPCLALIHQLHQLESTANSHGTILRQLKRLIALNAVLPSRECFLTKYSKTWKSESKCTTWTQISPFLDDFLHIINEAGHSREHSGNGLAVDTDHIPYLFEIAISIIPQSDSRKRQMEQTWLDAFVLVLTFLKYPSFPKLNPDEQGVLNESSSKPGHMTNNDKVEHLPVLQKLLDLSLEHDILISLPTLTYLMSAVVIDGIMAGERNKLSWPLIAALIKVNIDVLLPLPDAPNAENCLFKIVNEMETVQVDEENYVRIRDEISLPIMRSFAKSRMASEFINIWQNNLQKALAVPGSGDAPQQVPAILMWDDEELIEQFVDLAGVHASQGIFQNALSPLLQSLTGLNPQPNNWDEMVSKITIATAFLKRLYETPDIFIIKPDVATKLSQMVTSVLSEHFDVSLERWRLWRFLRYLQNTNPQQVKLTENWQAELLFVSMAGIRGFKSIKDTKKRASSYMEALECFSISLQLQPGQLSQGSTNLDQELLSLITLLKEINLEQKPSAFNNTWNGQHLELKHIDQYVGACFVKLMQYPSLLLSHIDSVTREKLYATVLEFIRKASTNATSSLHTSSSLLSLLEIFCSTQDQMNDEVFGKLLLQCYEQNASSGVTLQRLILRSRLWRNLREPELEDLVVKLMERLKRQTNTRPQQISIGELALLNQISIFQPSIKPLQDWRLWIEILGQLSEYDFGTTENDFETAYESVVSILDRLCFGLFKINTTEKDVHDKKDIKTWSQNSIKSIKTFDYKLSDHLLLESVIHMYTANSSSENVKSPEAWMQKLQTRYLNLVIGALDRLSNVEMTSEVLIKVQFALQTILRIIEPVQVSKELNLTLETIRRAINELSEEKQLNNEHKIANIQRLVQNIQSLNKNIEKSSEPALLAFLASPTLNLSMNWSHITRQELDVFVQQLTVFLSELDMTQKARIMSALREEPWAAKLGVRRLIVTAMLIRTTDDESLSNSNELMVEFAKIGSLTYLTTVSSFQELLVSLETCKMVLDLHPGIVNQATIDTLLASIYSLLSAIDNVKLQLETHFDYSADGGAAVFERVASVVVTVLTRYRRRISDRFHLLLPVLQKLLRCLFYPGVQLRYEQRNRVHGNNPVVFMNSLPVWLKACTQPLPAYCGERYSQILTLICNPSVSAARSSTKRIHSDLHDDVKEARKLAGQHMQYIIMEYARSTLDGRIQPHVKDRLMPGLYSILDAMNRDLMRSMNTAMDPSSRAIFKALYDDWTRFGKWDNN